MEYFGFEQWPDSKPWPWKMIAFTRQILLGARSVRVVFIAGLDQFTAFDFAYYKDYYTQVCGVGAINELANNPADQEVVRKYFVGFINRHIQEQMMGWFKRYSGVDGLVDEIAGLKQKTLLLEKPPVAVLAPPQALPEEEDVAVRMFVTPPEPVASPKDKDMVTPAKKLVVEA